MQYLTLKLHFFKILIAYLVNTFEMMDDLTCLMMKNMTISYHQHHSLSHVYYCLTFKSNYSNLLLEIIVENKSISMSPLETGLHANFG
jgi:hypothetical protein